MTIIVKKTDPMTLFKFVDQLEFNPVCARQITIIDQSLSNRKVQNTSPAIRREFAAIPQDALCVMESSSVWYERFRFIRDDLGYDMVLSNPAQTKAIAASKKKPTRSMRTSWQTCSGEDTS